MCTEPEGKSRKTDLNANCEPALLDAGDLTISRASFTACAYSTQPSGYYKGKLALILEQSAQDFHSFAESREFVSR